MKKDNYLDYEIECEETESDLIYWSIYKDGKLVHGAFVATKVQAYDDAKAAIIRHKQFGSVD